MGRQPVGDRHRRYGHRLARREGVVHRRGALRLDRDHAPVGRRRRDPRHEPTAPGRHHDRLDLGRVLEQLKGERSLAGHHQRVVKGMDERPSGLPDVLVQPLERLDGVRRFDVDLGAVAPRGGDLCLAGARIHDDEAVDLLQRRAPREGLGVVAGGDPDHAALLLLRRQRRELVEDAARLERAGLLEQLRLEVRLRPERAGAERGRAVDAAPDPLRRLQHVVAGQCHLASIVDSARARPPGPADRH